MAQELVQGLLEPLTERLNIIIVPRANPDGAEAGSQATANGADMDRDHLVLSTPEARALAALVRDELSALAMPHARLRFAIAPLPELGPWGADQVQLLCAANAGTDLAPLAKAASTNPCKRATSSVRAGLR